MYRQRLGHIVGVSKQGELAYKCALSGEATSKLLFSNLHVDWHDCKKKQRFNAKLSVPKHRKNVLKILKKLGILSDGKHGNLDHVDILLL